MEPRAGGDGEQGEGVEDVCAASVESVVEPDRGRERGGKSRERK